MTNGALNIALLINPISFSLLSETVQMAERRMKRRRRTTNNVLLNLRMREEQFVKPHTEAINIQGKRKDRKEGVYFSLKAKRLFLVPTDAGLSHHVVDTIDQNMLIAPWLLTAVSAPPTQRHQKGYGPI